tara:strand:- start:2496 stop:3674 length:1179 start_codon:yes stop_codon:yes gene_type:complete
MKADYFISLKYLFSKTKYNLVSFISGFSILVLSIAYFSFLTILSVFSGLENYSLQFSKSFDPDIKIEPIRGSYLSIDNKLDSILDNYDNIEEYSKVVKGNVVVRYDEKTEYAEIYGVDNLFRSVVNIDSIISIGRYPISNTNEVLSSYNLASNLNLILYNSAGIFELFSINSKYPESSLNPIGNTKRVVSSGVFTPRNDMSKNLIITDLITAQKILTIDESLYSEILIKSRKSHSASLFLKDNLSNYTVKTHKELNESLYKIMNSEKLIVSLIMILIVFISAFNVIASTVMLIVEKENDIKTMKAMGMSKKNIKSLFFKHNFLLNVIGGIIGIALSIIIIYAQLNFSFFKIPGLEIGYPVAIKFMNIVFVIITVIITGFCSAYISSLVLKKN